MQRNDFDLGVFANWNWLGGGISLLLCLVWGIGFEAWPLQTHQVLVPMLVSAIAWAICLAIGVHRAQGEAEIALASQGNYCQKDNDAQA